MSVKVIYKTSAKATGGRDGAARSDDGSVDVKLVVPKEMGGPGGVGANPEKLFGAGRRILPSRKSSSREASSSR